MRPKRANVNPFRSGRGFAGIEGWLRVGRMTTQSTDQSFLSARLLAGLARFRAEAASGTVPHGRSLFSYCARRFERLAAVELPHPVIGILLAGRKEVWRGTEGETMTPGTMFVLPGRVGMDVLNIPDERRGIYQSLLLEIRASDLPDVLPPVAGFDTAAKGSHVRLTDGLVEAVLRAATALADEPARDALQVARLTELLALLHRDPAARPLFMRSAADRVVQLVRGDLAHDWTAAEVAERLGLSELTLRRRLAAEGPGFARLLRRERMQAARARIAGGEGSQAAALAVGYASRAHFARQYRAAFGEPPSGA